MQSQKKDTFESNETPFNLVSSFEPCGDQPGAISRVVENLEAGVSYQTLLGVTGSGKTFTMANIINKLQRPALIFAPNKILAAQLYGEMKSFFHQTVLNTLYLIMTIILLKLMFRGLILI